jgi:hypothetical protein
MIWLISLIIILFGVIGYAGYRIWFLAGSLADAQEYIEQLELTNEFMYDKILASYEQMQEIDRLGAFEKDDEAGTTFQLLQQVITDLKDEFNNGQESEEK